MTYVPGASQRAEYWPEPAPSGGGATCADEWFASHLANSVHHDPYVTFVFSSHLSGARKGASNAVSAIRKLRFLGPGSETIPALCPPTGKDKCNVGIGKQMELIDRMPGGDMILLCSDRKLEERRITVLPSHTKTGDESAGFFELSRCLRKLWA